MNMQKSIEEKHVRREYNHVTQPVRKITENHSITTLTFDRDDY